MTSSHSPRRIAAHKLFIDGQLIDRPWVEIDTAGRITAQGRWNDLDRMPLTEFFSGILLPGHFPHTPLPKLPLPTLLQTLPQPRPNGLTLLEGIDLRTGEPLRPQLKRLV